MIGLGKGWILGLIKINGARIESREGKGTALMMVLTAIVDYMYS